MSWEKVKLEQIADTCLGKMLDQKKNKGDYQPYLANINVRWGEFDLDNLPLMRFESHEEERYGLRSGDLVICEGGEPGRCALWKNQVPGMKIQKALHRVRVHEDMDSRYLYYWFLYAGKRGALDQYYTGATIKHMPGDKLKSVVIDKPPLHVQNRIADILSTYDDLIENSKKQIKLLEEAAQRLYKEWFVDLRFPGYEEVEIIEDLPKGWKKGVLSDIAIDSGVREKKENRTKYSYYLPIDCLPKKSFAYMETNNIELAESSLVAFKENDILFGAMRPYFHKVVFARDNGLTRSTCFVLNAKNEEYWAYLLMLMFSDETVNYATKISVGTTMPYARWKDMVDMPIVIPSEDICIQFKDVLVAMATKIGKLAKQNIKLSETRDRLLPKLMSGEFEV